MSFKDVSTFGTHHSHFEAWAEVPYADYELPTELHSFVSVLYFYRERPEG